MGSKATWPPVSLSQWHSIFVERRETSTSSLNNVLCADSMVQIATALSHSVVLVTTAYISLTYQHSAIYERPIQSSIAILASSGCLFLLCTFLVPSWVLPFNSQESTRSTLPKHERLTHVGNFSTLLTPWRSISILPIRVRRQIAVVAIGICLMVGSFQITLGSRQCAALTRSGLLGFVPLGLVIYHYVKQRHKVAKGDFDGFKPSVPERPLSFLDDLSLGSSTIGVGVANILTRRALLYPISTYICPSSSYFNFLVPCVEILDLVLICFLLQTTADLVGDSGRWLPDLVDRPSVESVGYVSIVASSILTLGALVAFITHPMNWQWVFNFDRIYIWNLSLYIMLFTTFVLASVRILLENGLVHIATLVTFMTVFTASISYATSDLSILASPGLLPQFSFVVVLYSSLTLFVASARAGPRQRQLQHDIYNSKTSKIAQSILLIAAVILFWAIRSESKTLDSHPIWSFTQGVSSLMQQGATLASAWEKQASSSQTFDESVSEYWRRYQIPPPPGFDAWYRYATARNSVIIDDYDSIIEDLRPYWGINPAEIRLRTGQILSDTWNDVSEIRIRNGKADLGPNFKPTHRWMLDSILSMIKDFSLFLPDMDLAFNLHDEPRTTVPYTKMQQLEKAGSKSKSQAATSDLQHQWTAHRALQWDPLAELQPVRPFGDTPRINSFSAATVACPPASAARNSFFWDPQPLCTSCFAPHSSGLFLENWTLAASPCHQPDIRNLHGFYLSPAAFKTSTDLLPVFSQSKVAGFADILYPSPWNYIDKAVYAPDNTTHPDPPFTEKENTLFWRGGTSEGVSRFGTWKGMARQRLVHLADHPTSATNPMIIPHPLKPGKYIYDTHSLPSDAFSLNISIVSEIVRGWDNDAAAQTAEFTLAPPVDFQHHWQYRYLFDTDGAGFSGRFLPFLHSRSLPFRAGIFRTWYDARLTAWRHFVPVDIRLHGLLATLEYFAGRKGGAGAGGLEGGDTASGERIAEAGREWAARALRKEDMEIYMFRLLLEWGRITDDRRGEIGFAMPVPM